ncbi:MAG: hypothetical protein NTV49_11845 [Kiritimatiellaeota bacterium]|nr:hypothetical protein [Kiritimatiellota bacterium]
MLEVMRRRHYVPPSQESPFEIRNMAVVLAFGFSALVGIVFGLWPARKAALFADPACDRFFSYDQIHFDLYTTESGMTQPAPPGAQPGLERIALEIHKTLRGIVRGEEWASRRR